MKNAISWFEIPCNDLERATLFYETIFSIKMIPLEMPNIRMRMFPLDDMMSQVGGALVHNKDFYESSSSIGVLVYLNANPDVQMVLDKIPGAGGRILVPKTEISPDYGYMAVFIDCEGNRIALHSVPG